jgi:hypothetical protein
MMKSLGWPVDQRQAGAIVTRRIKATTISSWKEVRGAESLVDG